MFIGSNIGNKGFGRLLSYIVDRKSDFLASVDLFSSALETKSSVFRDTNKMMDSLIRGDEIITLSNGKELDMNNPSAIQVASLHLNQLQSFSQIADSLLGVLKSMETNVSHILQ